LFDRHTRSFTYYVNIGLELVIHENYIFPFTPLPQESSDKPRSDMDEYVWSNHKPWVPRPLLSMHVRMGDKACEMKVAEFEEYMELADQIRSHFPNLNSIWLSTEMQVPVIYPNTLQSWNSPWLQLDNLDCHTKIKPFTF